MTNLLIAALALTQVSAWELKAPYKDNESDKYTVVMKIQDQGQEMAVDMVLERKISKKTDKGFEGTIGWTQLFAEGEQLPDETFEIALKPNGVLKSIKSDYGDAMRRMFLPFFFTYPEKAVAKDAAWTYKDEQEDETDAHKASVEYKVVGEEKVKDKQAMKVSFTMAEEGPSPMKSSGFFWVAQDGKVLKYELDVTGWPVPVAGSVFDAKITGDLVG